MIIKKYINMRMTYRCDLQKKDVGDDHSILQQIALILPAVEITSVLRQRLADRPTSNH